jgi:hypothetical protein
VQDVGIVRRKYRHGRKKVLLILINEMADYLNVSQMKKLQEILLQTFSENVMARGRRLYIEKSDEAYS